MAKRRVLGCLLLLLLLPLLPCFTAWRMITGTYPANYNPHNGYTAAAFILALDAFVLGLWIHAAPWHTLLWLWAAACTLAALVGSWIARPR